MKKMRFPGKFMCSMNGKLVCVRLAIGVSWNKWYLFDKQKLPVPGKKEHIIFEKIVFISGGSRHTVKFIKESCPFTNFNR